MGCGAGFAKDLNIFQKLRPGLSCQISRTGNFVRNEQTVLFLTLDYFSLLGSGTSLIYTQKFITNRHLTHDCMQRMDTRWKGGMSNKYSMVKNLPSPRFEPTAFWLALSCASCVSIWCTAATFCPTHMGPFKWSVLWGVSPSRRGCQQAIWNTVQTFPEPVHLESLNLSVGGICHRSNLPSPTFYA